MSQFFKLMSDENRLNILRFVGLQERCVGEIVDFLNVEQSLVSHHLKKLRVNGILKVRVEGQKRIYSIANPEILEILERCARTIETVAEVPLGKVGKERVERELRELQPQREEEFLELVKIFEREFTLLYGKTIGKRAAEEMRRVVRENLEDCCPNPLKHLYVRCEE